MKITRVESLHAHAGWRVFDYLKISTDSGLVGWSEYNEGFGGLGISTLIDRLAPELIGQDPRPYESLIALLQSRRRAATSGAFAQAIGAIENALLDLTARALNVPVYALLGGPMRERIRLYWSHCGNYRIYPNRAAIIGVPPVRTLDDMVAQGREVAARGYSALKTNILLLSDTNPRPYTPAFVRGEGHPELNPEPYVLAGLRDQMAALREGAGPGVELLVDVSFNFKTEGYLRLARLLESFDLLWLELDTHDAPALRTIRQQSRLPIASGECLFGRRGYRSFLEHGALDVAIVDVPWNGLAESVKIAAMADAYETNVAPHNFYSHLATMMSAHFAAIVPNLRIMEVDPDMVPWQDDLVTVRPEIVDGYLRVPTGPGWGTEVNEEAIRAHPAPHR